MRAAPRAEWVAAHRRERGVGLVRRGTTATSLPSLATYSGSMPSRSQAPVTAGSTGSAASSSTTAEVRVAGQLVADGADPAAGRVAHPAGRRRGGEQRLDQAAERRGVGADVGLECEVAAGQHHGHAVVGRWCPTRARTSPGCTARAPRSRPAGIDADAGGRDVEPVGRAPADHLGVAGDDGDARRPPPPRPCRRRWRAARRREALLDARTRPTATAAARPSTARSLTVPCTARWPIDPPGKRRGCTTNESVVNASRSPDGSVRRGRVGQRADAAPPANASRNTASTSAADALPPAPWARVITSSVRRGRRRRNASMRSRTAASRSPSAVASTDSSAARHCCESRPAPRATARTERGLGLLDAVDAVGIDDQAVVDVR